jgi:hypothetical protein
MPIKVLTASSGFKCRSGTLRSQSAFQEKTTIAPTAAVTESGQPALVRLTHLDALSHRTSVSDLTPVSGSLPGRKKRRSWHV